MDDSVVIFKPRVEQDAEDNLRNFIVLAKEQLTAFGSGLVFDADSWDVTDFVRLKRRNTRSSIRFHGFPSGRGQKDSFSFPQPYKDFAKAYCRYDYALGAYTTVSSRLAALRSLAAALEETESCVSPVKATLGHFNRASSILHDRYQTHSAHAAGLELKRISEFLVEHQLCAIPIQWRNPLRAPASTARRVGPVFDAARQARLPSPASLAAIAEIFGAASAPGDIFTTSICALLASAPNRINEVLSVSTQCEVEEFDSKTNQRLYGLRWLPSKGGKAQVKWVVQSMVSVARDAVSKLMAISTPAREVARWYEQHPEAIYLPLELETLRGQLLITPAQVSAIVFATQPPNGNHAMRGTEWCRKQGVAEQVPYNPRQKNAPRFQFADIERVILAMLPTNFPMADLKNNLKYSNALCLTRLNELNTWGTYRGVMVLPDTGYIHARLSGKRAVLSIFERFGYVEQDGGRMSITTHQFRHYLNTLAQMGGLSQLDIAKWSGRAKLGHNSCYDHQSDRDVLALARSALGDQEKSAGHVASIPPSSLIARDQFAALKIMTAHTTDLGYCLHDFSMLPCQLHRDCLNCDEHVCIKGDGVRERAIRQHRQETQDLLAKALSALGEEEFGANRWVEHQTLTLKRLDELCAILADPSVAANAIIQPCGIVPASKLERILAHQRVLDEHEETEQSAVDPNVPRIDAEDL